MANKRYLDTLNFIGSICSITALLIVVFAEMDLIKALMIFISVVAGISLTAALASWIVPLYKRKFPYRNMPINIFATIFGSIIALFFCGLVFNGCYCMAKVLEAFIISLIQSVA